MSKFDYNAIFDLLLKNASTCEILVDLQGNIIRMNNACEKLIGYKEAEVKVSPKILYPLESDYYREIDYIEQLLSGKQSDIKFINKRKKKDGIIIPVEVTALLFRDDDGNPNFVLKRIKDISEKIKTDEYNKSQIAFLQTLLDEIPINIYFKDKESRFLLMSKNNIQFLGLNSIDQIIGKTDYDFFDEQHAREAFEDEQYIIRSGKSIVKEEREVHTDQSVTYVYTTKSPYKDEEGNIIGTFGISKDITDLKVAQMKADKINAELSEKNKMLEEAIDELHQTQNKLIFAEKMAALGALIGGVAHEINTPLGAIKASSTNIAEVVEKINIDLPWLVANASKAEVEWLFKLINKADARDISVFSKEERQRKRHLTNLFEENNIPNASNYADTLVSLRVDEPDEEFIRLLQLPHAQKLLQVLKVIFSLKRNANNIFVSVDKAAKVVRALKNYIYRNKIGELEAADLPETINTVLILTANALKHQKIEVKTHFESVPMVYCRQDELCQVWTNIITNAIQAMGSTGKLDIGIHKKDESTVQVWFKDTGGGIPDEVAIHIFERYYTTKEKGVGTGMGLDISKQIVLNHNGAIYFESDPGIGTTFFVDIPINIGEDNIN